MKRRIVVFLCAGLCAAQWITPAGAKDKDGSDDALKGPNLAGVQRFATLPAGQPGHPEGLCADGNGNVYADSFELSGPNNIYTFGRDGRVKAAMPVPTGVVPLGCAVSGNKFYMNDVINGNELQYSLPLTDSSLPDKTFPICGGFVGNPGPFCALNANYAGPDGRIYMSDNGDGQVNETKGRIWVLDPNTGKAGIFIQPPDLDVAPNGFPPFGVNGIAFSRDGSALYMANMSTGRIYKLNVHNCSVACQPGTFSLFSDDPLIQGPDNMDFDDAGNLWIASGQNQHVVVLNRRGKVVGVFGDFFGFTPSGAPRGLLQPSGIIYSDGKIFIGNESNQSLLPANYPVDWNQLKLFTISGVNENILSDDDF